MSSRQLRKLRKQQELGQQGDSERIKEELSEDDEPVTRKPRANVFSSFAYLAEDGDEDDEENDNQQQTPATAASGAPAGEDTPATSNKSKKKSKKKKKAKKPDPEPETEAPEDKNGMDEIDRALEQLKLAGPEAGASHSGSTDQYSQELAKLLSINTTHLKVLNEMRNLFGRETIQAAGSDSDPQATSDRRRLRQGEQHVTLEQYLKGRPGQSISEVLLRRNPFVQGKEHWPKASAGGLTMKLIEGSGVDGTTEFAFAHDKAYDAMEAVFFQCVQTHDPMMLVHFLQGNPYHVSSLIQVSKVAKQDQNSALAGDLCERALFTFGRVTLSSFRDKLKEGRARLSFRRPENRQFWLVGHHYVRSLMMKGTYRTALEWAKLLLSLSPADEYGMLNLIHVLAVRARESRWFLNLCCDNDFFTFLMARHVPNRDYIRQTAILAKLQLGDREGARAQLASGIEQLPWLYCSLFSALNLDTPKSIWGIRPRNQSEELYTELYVSQAKDLWNNTEASGLLKEVAGSIQRPQAYETLPEADDVGPSTARFVYLDNTPALMALVPHALMHASPNFDFDPLPPPAAENLFSSAAQRLPWDAARGDGGGAQLADMFARMFPADQRRLRDQQWEQLLQEQEQEFLRAQGGPGQDGDAADVADVDASAAGMVLPGAEGMGNAGVLARLAELFWGRRAPADDSGGAGQDDEVDNAPYGQDWEVEGGGEWGSTSTDTEEDANHDGRQQR